MSVWGPPVHLWTGGKVSWSVNKSNNKKGEYKNRSGKGRGKKGTPARRKTGKEKSPVKGWEKAANKGRTNRDKRPKTEQGKKSWKGCIVHLRVYMPNTPDFA